jgi:endoglucanase
MIRGMTRRFAPARRRLLAAAPLLLARPSSAQPALTGPTLTGPTSAGPAAPRAPDDALRREWARFRDMFMTADGRVVDTGNGGISHSEGQGWAMLCAARAEDRLSFQRLHSWSMRVLKRRQDELFAWRYTPGRAMTVADSNNATDGDLFIAWALLEAGARWGRAEHTAQGTAIAREILRRLVRPAGGHVVLMPGLRGFERQQHVVLNPSYYAFPAIRALAAAVPDPMWLRVTADGIALLRRARFGRWRLPPDWLMLAQADERVSPAIGWPARFSYDAVRVPLYFAWVGLAEEPALTAPAQFWYDQAHRHLPAWADFSNDGVSPYPASPGIEAVAQLSRLHYAGDTTNGLFGREIIAHSDYYSGALSLLVALAARDSGFR